jgi:hypothetical protein
VQGLMFGLFEVYGIRATDVHTLPRVLTCGAHKMGVGGKDYNLIVTLKHNISTILPKIRKLCKKINCTFDNT